MADVARILEGLSEAVEATKVWAALSDDARFLLATTPVSVWLKSPQSRQRQSRQDPVRSLVMDRADLQADCGARSMTNPHSAHLNPAPADTVSIREKK